MAEPTTSRARSASPTTRASAARSSPSARTRSSRSSASRPSTTTRWRSGPADSRRRSSSRFASCRSGTWIWPPPRCAATRPEECARWPSPRCRPGWGSPPSTPATGTPSSRPARRPARSSACTSARAPRRSTPARTHPRWVGANLIACNSVSSMIDWIFSGKLEQFPKLKLLYAECQIGWIPYFIERADDTWQTHQWAQGETRIPNPPSFYYRRNVFGCFFKDTVGIDMIDRIGGRQRDVRDRLPPPGRHLSALEAGGRGAVRSPRRGVGLQDRARGMRSSCWSCRWSE